MTASRRKINVPRKNPTRPIMNPPPWRSVKNQRACQPFPGAPRRPWYTIQEPCNDSPCEFEPCRGVKESKSTNRRLRLMVLVSCALISLTGITAFIATAAILAWYRRDPGLSDGTIPNLKHILVRYSHDHGVSGYWTAHRRCFNPIAPALAARGSRWKVPLLTAQTVVWVVQILAAAISLILDGPLPGMLLLLSAQLFPRLASIPKKISPALD